MTGSCAADREKLMFFHCLLDGMHIKAVRCFFYLRFCLIWAYSVPRKTQTAGNPENSRARGMENVSFITKKHNDTAGSGHHKQGALIEPCTLEVIRDPLFYGFVKPFGGRCHPNGQKEKAFTPCTLSYFAERSTALRIMDRGGTCLGSCR